jgi:hypothetical protein
MVTRSGRGRRAGLGHAALELRCQKEYDLDFRRTAFAEKLPAGGGSYRNREGCVTVTHRPQELGKEPRRHSMIR